MKKLILMTILLFATVWSVTNIETKAGNNLRTTPMGEIVGKIWPGKSYVVKSAFSYRVKVQVIKSSAPNLAKDGAIGWIPVSCLDGNTIIKMGCNLRESVDASSEILGGLYKGTTVKIIDQSTPVWYVITVDGKDLYVWIGSLSIKKE